MDRARIGLRTGHKGLYPDIDGKASLDSAENAAEDHQLLPEGLFQVVPCADPRGLGVRKEYVSFLRFPVVEHNVDHIAALHSNITGRPEKLLNRNETFGLITEVDDYFL